MNGMTGRAALLVSALAVLLASAAAPAQAASFDCTRARTPDEIAVCKHRDLSELDTEMGALWFAYRRVPFLMGASGARQDDAREFLRKRAACGCAVPCLRGAYRARIKALKDDLGRAMNGIFREENGLQASPVSAVTSASPLPAPVEAIIASYADRCRQLGGELSTGVSRPRIMTGDLDRDGKPDYVLNPENLRCNAAATAFCGNGGCEISVAVSRNGYRNPITILGGQPQLKGAQLDVWVDRSNCNIPGADRKKACWASYSWTRGKVHKTYRPRPLS